VKDICDVPIGTRVRLLRDNGPGPYGTAGSLATVLREDGWVKFDKEFCGDREWYVEDGWNFEIVDAAPLAAATEPKPVWEPLGWHEGVRAARLVVPGGTFYRIASETYLILDRTA
jgi:hypothetical protein